MKSEARVVVIGGGVVGCSVLYHLTKAGWKDVVLVERDQLTSGSTWHAAGGFHTLNGDPNVAKLQGYTIGLYDELERISGQSCGLHRTGGLLLADTPERMEWLKMAHGRARYLGLETELLTPKEAKKLLPLIEERYFVGAMLDAADGNLDPSGTTHAYAKSARIGGAEIYLQARVTALERRAGGTWKVITDKGTIHAEHVVNCGGLWAREIGAWWAWSSRCSRWSTCISSRTRCPKWSSSTVRTATSCRTRSTSRPRSTCARSAAACCSVPTRRPASPGSPARRPGTSATSCCPPTSSASRRRSSSATATSRRWSAPASSAASTVPSPFPPTATRSWAPCRDCPATGAPAP